MKNKFLTPIEIVLLAFILLCVAEIILGAFELSYCDVEPTTQEETTTFRKEEFSRPERPTKIVVETTTEEQTEQPTEPPIVYYYTEEDVVDLAKLLFVECGGVDSMTEQACVAWTVLNRVDNSGSSIYKVLRAPNQYDFRSWIEPPEEQLYIARDVLERWNLEKNGQENVGRVLPRDYTYFYGDGFHNYFRNAYNGDYDTWDYSLESPYID